MIVVTSPHEEPLRRVCRRALRETEWALNPSDDFPGESLELIKEEREVCELVAGKEPR